MTFVSRVGLRARTRGGNPTVSLRLGMSTKRISKDISSSTLSDEPLPKDLSFHARVKVLFVTFITYFVLFYLLHYTYYIFFDPTIPQPFQLLTVQCVFLGLWNWLKKIFKFKTQQLLLIRSKALEVVWLQSTFRVHSRIVVFLNFLRPLFTFTKLSFFSLSSYLIFFVRFTLPEGENRL